MYERIEVIIHIRLSLMMQANKYLHISTRVYVYIHTVGTYNICTHMHASFAKMCNHLVRLKIQLLRHMHTNRSPSFSHLHTHTTPPSHTHTRGGGGG